MRKVEILAPAGSLDSLRAAINASCDAVYIGGSKFGARAYADNPGEDSLIEAIDLAHIHNKKIYLTVNTLLKNSELEKELYDYLEKYYLAGIDAVIVQDLGVLHFIQEHFPRLDIHASTQMTLTMAQGLEALKHKGVTRLVNSRELSLEEIKLIRSNTNIEIESFVHGALCYCYSGQCLMSSMIGGRSGNRGRCAQTCRMPYQLIGDNKKLLNEQDKYILSPKDICTLDMIPDLIEAGISSFKIEGRMKRPEYAAGVTHIYGKYVDLYSELGRENYETYLQTHKDEFEADMLNLQDLYNRGGFSQGYYNNKNGKSMISLQRPNHSGVFVGTIKAMKGTQVEISLKEDIFPQDILEIREFDKQKGTKVKNDYAKNSFGSIFEFTVKDGQKKGGTYKVNISRGLEVEPGYPVYRTKNNSLLEHLDKEYLEEGVKVPMTGTVSVVVGEPLKLVLTCRNIRVFVTGDIVEEAKNQPMTEEKIKKQVMKTNDTSFYFENLELLIEGLAFIPLQKINELRRNGIEALEKEVAASYRRNGNQIRKIEHKDFDNKEELRNNTNQTISVHVAVEKTEQLEVACSIPEVTDLYIDCDIAPLPQITEFSSYAQSKGKRCYIILPHIFRNSTYQYYKKYKNILEDNTIYGYILRNLEEYEFVKNELDYQKKNKDIITDYNLYVMNREAAKFWSELDIQKFTAPVELNYAELRELTGMYYDIIVYGRIPLMVSAQCVVKTASGRDNKYSNRESDKPCCEPGINTIEIIDRYQKSFQIKRHCRDCYNTIYNSQCLSLLENKDEVMKTNPANIRLNFTFETAEETKVIIETFVKQYIYNEQQKLTAQDYTRGHFKRGIE